MESESRSGSGVRVWVFQQPVKALPPPTRRGLTREESADYLSISPNMFDRLVAEGLMPKRVQVYSRKVWDVRRIDSLFDALQGLPSSPQAAEWE